MAGPSRLPAPNEFGDYHFKDFKPAAIMQIHSIPEYAGKWFVVLPDEGGIVWGFDNRFRPFATAKDAMVYLICHCASVESAQKHSRR